MIKYLLLLLPTVWTLCLHDAHAGETSRHYPFSIAAARQTVTQWLQQNGYSCQVIPEPGCQVRIRSSNRSEQWLIELKPRSPLTTVVAVHLDGSEQKEERIEELLQHSLRRAAQKPGPLTGSNRKSRGPSWSKSLTATAPLSP